MFTLAKPLRDRYPQRQCATLSKIVILDIPAICPIHMIPEAHPWPTYLCSDMIRVDSTDNSSCINLFVDRPHQMACPAVQQRAQV